MTIEWNDRFNTSDVQMNHQHKRLFALVNHLIHSSDTPQAGKCTQQLLDYLDAHFAYEEMQMRDESYPMEEAHCHDHANLRTKMRLLQQNHNNLSPALYKFQLVAVFKEWTQHHIPLYDTKLAEFLSYGETRHADL